MAASTGKAYAQQLLGRQFKELSKNPPEGISVGLKDDNLFHWTVLLVGPPGTYYADGFFNAELTFPDEFPNMPPTMKFTDELWHPNIYPDGKVCISILHTPGVDAMNAQETADERWRPIIGVETVLVSVLSMLSDPNIESPANIDAAKQFRDDVKGFKRRCRACVRATQDDSD